MDGASVLDESLDDTHSFLDMELEALQSIYINEIEVDANLKSTTVSIDLHPATADKLDEQYVRMSLQFTLDEEYPGDIPKVKIRNPRGLSEEKINCVMKDLLAIAESKRGNSMLFEMIEAAKEHLTVGNRPCGECAICLHGFSDKDTFTKTECYHYFHSHCLARYSKYFLESSKDSETADSKSDAKSNELLCPMCRVPIQFQGDEKDYPLPNASDDSHFTLTDEIVDLQKRMADLFQKQVEKGGIIDIEAEKNKFLIEISNVPTRVNNEEKLEQKQQVEYEATDKTDTSDQVDSPSREKRYNRDQNKRTDYRGRNRNFNKQNENWGNYRSGGRYNNRQSYDDFHGNHNRNKYDRYSAQRFDRNRGNFRRNNEDSKQFPESARNSELQSLDAAERQDFAGSSVQCEDTSEIVQQQISDTKSKPTSSSPRYNRGYRRGNNYSYNSHYGDRRSDKSSFQDSQNSHVPNKQSSVDNEDEDACKYEDREPKERTSEYGEYRKPNYRSDRYRPDNNYIPRERYSDGRNSRRGGNVDDEDEDSKERIDYGEPRKPHYRSDKYRQDNYIPRERYSDGRNSQRGIAIDNEDGDTGKAEDKERTSEYSVRKPHYRTDRYRQDNDYNSKERYSDSRNPHRGGRGGYMRRGNYSHDPHFSGKNRYVDTDKDQYYADRDRNYRGRRMLRDDRYRGNTHDGYRQKNSRNYAANNYAKPTNEHYQTSTSENHESVDLSSRSHSSDSNHHSVDSGTLDNVSSSSKYTKSLLDKTEAEIEVDSSDFDKKSSIKMTDKPAEDESYIPPPTVMNEKPPASLRTALNPPPGFANPLKKVIYGLQGANPPPGFNRS